MIRRWSHLDHSSSFPQFGHISAFSKHDIFFFITSDLHRHFGATSGVLFTGTEPRHTSYLQGMTLVFLHHAPSSFLLCFAYCFCFCRFLYQVHIVWAIFLFTCFSSCLFLCCFLYLFKGVPGTRGMFFFNSRARLSCIYILYFVFVCFCSFFLFTVLMSPLDRRHVILVLVLSGKQKPWPSRPL